jgi:hypothetical protein
MSVDSFFIIGFIFHVDKKIGIVLEASTNSLATKNNKFT